MIQNIVGKKWVVIPALESHQGFYATTILLNWECPVCGGPRGEVVHNTRSYDGSCILYCDGWTNPCGHVDKYDSVREEAMNNGLNFKSQ